MKVENIDLISNASFFPFRSQEEVILKCKYIGAGQCEPFQSIGKYQQPVIECLKSGIRENHINHRKNDISKLRIYVEQENTAERLYVNPNAPAGWYTDCVIKYDFKTTITSSDIRNYGHDIDKLKKKRVSLIIDQSEGSAGQEALQMRYTGKILVEGFVGERIYQLLKKDGRFKKDFLESCIMKESSGTGTTNKNSKVTASMNNKVFFLRKGKRMLTKRQTEDEADVSAQKMKLDENDEGSKMELRFTPKPLDLHMIWGETSSEEKVLVANFGDAQKYDWATIFKPCSERSEKDKKEVNKISKFVEGFSNHVDVSTSVESLEKLLFYSKSVCRILYPDAGQATGFIIGSVTQNGEDIILIMTNHHVLDGICKGWRRSQVTKVNFDYTNRDTSPSFVTVIENCVFVKDSRLDFAVIGVKPKDLPESMSDFQNLGGLFDPEYDLVGKSVLQLVGHPKDRVKRVDQLVLVTDPESELLTAIRNIDNFDPSKMVNKEFVKDPTKIHYHCRSFEGSSGSPVFGGGNLVALHVAGIWLNREEKQNNRYSNLEVGIPMDLIVQCIYEKIRSGDAYLQEEDIGRLFPHFDTYMESD